MIVGFARHSRDSSFTVLGRNKAFLLVMAIGSVVGAWFGGLLLRQSVASWLSAPPPRPFDRLRCDLGLNSIELRCWGATRHGEH